MARSRDYKAEYAARSARAKARGYSGYGQQEYQRRNREARRLGWASARQRQEAYREVKASESWAYFRNQREQSPYEEDELVKAFSELKYEGYDDYGPESWHKYLLVDLLGYMTDEEWAAHYPNGVRDFGIR